MFDSLSGRDLSLLGWLLTPSRSCREHTDLLRQTTWAVDNECFAQGEAFDFDRYLRFLDTLEAYPQETLRFITVPDVVAEARATAQMLCGSQFGLKVYRHRIFESSLLWLAPPHFPHRDQLRSNQGPSPKGFVTVAGDQFTLAQGQRAMGIDWMTKREMAQATPPAYTRFIGEQLRRCLHV